MEDKENVIRELQKRIDALSRQQRIFQDEILKLHQDITSLKTTTNEAVNPPRDFPAGQTIDPSSGKASTKVDIFLTPKTFQPPPPKVSRNPTSSARSPWEDFIGANLLNKVGIAVLVLGVAFGAKYSIDRELIDNTTRIILGYLAGIALASVAYRLKKEHPGFSAVLLSGGMAVLYFITYAAFDFYQMIPQTLAFGLMVLFTVFTVFASLQYNLQVVGIIGLVGAYAVPFLLSDGSGRVVILFSYVTIINCGILFLAFRKYWKSLYYLAFIFTWLTFATWYSFSFRPEVHIWTSLGFSTIFLLTFYITFLAYKLIRKETLDRWDIAFMLLNSFIYFGYGYLTIEEIRNGEQYLGLFTVFTAFIHFIASAFIYTKQGRSNDVFYFVGGMVLVFLIIAVPIQLEGSWVTLVWAGQAALLFWIGRTKSLGAYEKLSYPLIALAFISLLHDWSSAYPQFHGVAVEQNSAFRIFLNIQFLTSMMVAAAFLFMILTGKRFPETSVNSEGQRSTVVNIGLPILFAIVVYFGFYKEIEAFWNFRHAASGIASDRGGNSYFQYDPDLLSFKNIWLILYSSFFAMALSAVQFKLKSQLLQIACVAVNSIVLVALITVGLLELTELRSSFLTQHLSQYFQRDYVHLWIRYLAIALTLPLLWLNTRLLRREAADTTSRIAENLFFHFVILVLLSSELIHWLDIARVENTFKLSLSILWGSYALFLIVLGLSRNQKPVRVGAIVLFTATLLKLFAYDMADMSTILKTVVMIILGTLLLTASFIYNKHKRSAEQDIPEG
jgi:uncharacterized membrane protein